MHQSCFWLAGRAYDAPIELAGDGDAPSRFSSPLTPSTSRSGPACYPAPNTNYWLRYATIWHAPIRTSYQKLLATPLSSDYYRPT